MRWWDKFSISWTPRYRTLFTRCYRSYTMCLIWVRLSTLDTARGGNCRWSTYSVQKTHHQRILSSNLPTSSSWLSPSSTSTTYPLPMPRRTSESSPSNSSWIGSNTSMQNLWTTWRSIWPKCIIDWSNSHSQSSQEGCFVVIRVSGRRTKKESLFTRLGCYWTTGSSSMKACPNPKMTPTYFIVAVSASSIFPPSASPFSSFYSASW